MSPRSGGVSPYPVDIMDVDRGEFWSTYFDYGPGQHVTCLAPTGAGKTQLLLDGLGRVTSRDLRGVVLVMKPKDVTASRFAARWHYGTVRDWPPPMHRRWIDTDRSGWLLWPTETDDPDADDERHKQIFRRCLRERYRTSKKRPNIVFADETYSLEHEMNLTKDLRRIWTKGRSAGCGLWSSSQRPVMLSRLALQAHHLFIGYDPDVDMQRRYGEIGGGVAPQMIREVVATLPEFSFLYIHRNSRSMCIVRGD
jgi:hypothetical protein